MALCYQNQTSNSLPALRLHLDPNMNPNLSLEVISVEDETGKPLAWSHQPLRFGNLHSDKGLLDIKLAKALAPFRATTVSMRFSSSDKNIGSRMVMLQDDPYQSLDGWYPKAMTARGSGWSLDDDRPAAGASGLIALFVLWLQQRLNAARKERDELRQRVTALRSLGEERARLVAPATQAYSRLIQKEHLELMRLRGEVGLLRSRVKQQASQAATNAAQNTTSDVAPDAGRRRQTRVPVTVRL